MRGRQDSAEAEDDTSAQCHWVRAAGSCLRWWPGLPQLSVLCQGSGEDVLKNSSMRWLRLQLLLRGTDAQVRKTDTILFPCLI